MVSIRVMCFCAATLELTLVIIHSAGTNATITILSQKGSESGDNL